MIAWVFYAFAVLAVGFSFLVAFHKNPVVCALSLVAVFFCFAALFVLLEAPLIAALQILVYAGAVMVLFLFVVLLLRSGVPSLDLKRTPLGTKAVVSILVFFLLGMLGLVFRGLKISFFTQKGFSGLESAKSSTRVLSELLFSKYVLPFELTSLILLVAIVGTVVIALRKPSLKRRTHRVSR